MLKRVIVIIMALVISSCSAQDSDVEDTIDYESTYTEIDLINRINTIRDSLGLSVLTENKIVKYYAVKHYRRIYETEVVSHNFFYDRSQEIMVQTDGTLVEEVISFGMYDNYSTINAWLNSQSHKDAILNDEYNEVGIANKRLTDDNNLCVLILLKNE